MICSVDDCDRSYGSKSTTGMCSVHVQRIAAKRWRDKQGSRWRYNRHLIRKFGITIGDYDAMMEAQDSKCAICRTDDPGAEREFFCVDHDHQTGQVRGLLCQHCNKALGFINDSVVWLGWAKEYLWPATPHR